MSLDVSKPSGEQRLPLEAWNDTAQPYPRDLAAHTLFERAAGADAGSVAVSRRGSAVTYADLDARANRLARHLRRLGAGRGEVVAVRVPASVDMVVAVLAVLKSGAAYLPLDRDLPRNRQEFMLDDAAARLVVTSSDTPGPRLRDVASGGRVIVDLRSARASIDAEPADRPPVTVTGDDLAYVMYTSGSTGRPKGVLVPHRGIVRLVCGLTDMQLDRSLRLLQLAPLSFDASVLEIFAPLLHGGTVVLSDPDLTFVDRFLDAVDRGAPNAAVLVTPQVHVLVDHHLEVLGSLRQVLFGGDVASVEHVRRAHAAIGGSTRLVHAYGPTESTVVATTWRVDRIPDRGSLPIGRPIGNTEAYVLDDRQRLVPIGDEGELCLGGDGLALGYLNQPELTSRAFVAHPFSHEPGARLYRTGDRCRHLPDGTLEFLGREDDQVKVRGHRIELGEVEAVLHRHPEVRQCAVVTREVSRDRALVAYVVPRTPAVSVDELRRHVAERLSDAMRPSAYVLLDRLPTTRNGKVDRGALPDPDRDHADVTEPTSEAEQRVAAAFRDVLDLDAVGLDDDFAQVGGTSLTFVDLHVTIDAAYPGRITLADVVAAGTVRGIALLLAEPAARVEP